jgi:Bacterial PH domain
VNRRTPYVAREHEFEAQHGLPERLPAGEHILWQGAPRWQAVARQVFHADIAALYFAAMLAWRFASTWADGVGLAESLRALGGLALLFAIGLGALVLLGWWTARTTAYTLTDRRVVMRIGIVLTVTYNLPLARIEGADLRLGSHGRGDIALLLEPATRIAWLHLWPHVRPWRVARPQPMLRGLDAADGVATLLRRAWVNVNGPAVGATVQREAPTRDRPAPALVAH